MGSDKETKKLGAEELSKRVAPLSTPYVVPTDPTGDLGGGGAGTPDVQADQPGKSGTHRDKPFQKTEI
ncbi:MAG TPA: hypothetical protein VFG76_09420 [Candidatus Polarisedimenticolia bacterium]|nr:hypothetical protein [Candidatus Polarisedimenticolia bacterium]